MPSPGNKKFNVTQTTRRKTPHKAKRISQLHIENVYEYAPVERNRRFKVDTSLSKEERAGTAGEEEVINHDMEKMKERLIQQIQGDDLAIASDEDEEIDSDEAFEESDEERFAEFRFSKKSTRTLGRLQLEITHDLVDHSTDDEDPEASGSEGYYDVLDMLDGRVHPNTTDTTQPESKEQRVSNDHSLPLSGEVLSEEESSDTGDDDSMDDGALEKLDSFIGHLDHNSSLKRHQEVEPADEQPKRQRRKLITELNELGEESEFFSRSGGEKLNISDLLEPLGQQGADFDLLKKNVKILETGSKALPAPLPLRTQAKLDRDAAYEQTKGSLLKWQSSIKHIREADHLRFPLQTHEAAKTSNAELAAKFQPSNKLESSVDRLLKAAHLRDKEIDQQEELRMVHLSPEEIAKQREELRYMRELMFRSDVKAKRLSKIKSKAYRKILKKTRAREREKLEEAGLLNGHADPDDDDDERVLREAERALQRATLRHKNVGKWAQELSGKHGLSISERQSVSEQLERGEQLRKKILEHPESEVESSDDSETEKEKLRELGRIDDDLHSVPKGIMAMKFMQNAERNKLMQIRDDAINFLSENHANAADQADDGDPGSKTGRMIFFPGSQANDDVTNGLTGPQISSVESVSDAEDGVPSSMTESNVVTKSNPWLAEPKQGSKRARTKNSIVIAKENKPVEKSQYSMSKRTKATGTGQKKAANEEGSVDISIDAALKRTERLQKSVSKPHSAHPSEDGKNNPQTEDDDEQEEQFKLLSRRGVKDAIDQRKLVTRAFAGDDVTQEFLSLKEKEVEVDATKVEDVTLPGWGSWSGPGISKKTNQTARNKMKAQSGIEASKRKDFAKSHVVISEKSDRKAAKYHVKDLPYPFTSKSQFEHSLATPLGTEWNTRTGFQRGTLPKVMTKMGTIIQPMQQVAGD